MTSEIATRPMSLADQVHAFGLLMVARANLVFLSRILPARADQLRALWRQLEPIRDELAAKMGGGR
jgi:hypothetical protein